MKKQREKSELHSRDRYEVAEGIPCKPIKNSDKWLVAIFIILFWIILIGAYLLFKK